ncbi:MAG: hypothetical protein Q7K16_02895 [Candidatus Azambacteria bacterium]|nr:hypothetical protein [Candidatus Azambacteria bacterium]
MRYLIDLFASISSLFFLQINKPNNIPVPPLNTAIISFQDTYYTPTVSDPDNFPKTKSVVLAVQNTKSETKPTPKPEVVSIAPPPLAPPTPPPPPPPAPTGDPYIALIEPITPWLRMNFTLGGDGFETPQPREFNINKIDREYWKIEVFAYWAVGVTPPKPPVENDYFKLEVYEKGTNKLIYTMTSGKEESFHKFQVFKKPGEYYFKTYTKPVMKYEMNLFVSSKIAQ